MKEIEFNVELTVRELYAFSMHHTYTGLSGIFGVFLSLGSLVVCAVRFEQLDTAARLILIFIGCLFTVIQPVMLYTKAKTQVKQNENINAALHYKLTEEGVVVSQGEQEVSVKWQDIRRRVKTKKAVYLYMSPVRAFIFPASQCGDFGEVSDFIDAQMKQCKQDSREERGQED